MKKRFSTLTLLIASSLLMLSGCSPIFTREGMRDVDAQIDIHQLRANPQAHAGRTVLMGGAIIAVENHADHTEVIILHHGLGFNNRPNPRRPSGERFLARKSGFLDPAIFHPGRWISVLGVVSGGEQRPLQQTVYLYPVVTVSELHLWPLDTAPGRNRFQFGLGIGIGL